jgi:hypothetical protein
MKKNLLLVAMAFAGGVVALGSYRLFFESASQAHWSEPVQAADYSTSFASLAPEVAGDFSMAAERTVNTVVHVKTTTTITSETGECQLNFNDLPDQLLLIHVNQGGKMYTEKVNLTHN